MGLWSNNEDGESKVKKLSKVYDTALEKWNNWLREKSGQEPSKILGDVETARKQFKELLIKASENVTKWDIMIELATSVKEAAEEWSNESKRPYGRHAEVSDATRTVEIL